jgi:hypothetical protein
VEECEWRRLYRKTNNGLVGTEQEYAEVCFVHAELAGGRLPSGYFGVNAAWWQIMILALNLSSAMKRLVLGETWEGRRLKAIRFWLITLPGRVLDHARTLRVRLIGGHPSNETLSEARRKVLSLSESG